MNRNTVNFWLCLEPYANTPDGFCGTITLPGKDGQAEGFNIHHEKGVLEHILSFQRSDGSYGIDAYSCTDTDIAACSVSWEMDTEQCESGAEGLYAAIYIAFPEDWDGNFSVSGICREQGDTELSPVMLDLLVHDNASDHCRVWHQYETHIKDGEPLLCRNHDFYESYETTQDTLTNVHLKTCDTGLFTSIIAYLAYRFDDTEIPGDERCRENLYF